MLGFSTYLRDKFLNLLRGVAWTVPATVYLGLYTTPTGPAAEGTEVMGGAYARQPITSATGWSAPATDGQGRRYVTNAAVITFPSPTAAWGTVTHAAIQDALTLGNRHHWDALPQSQQVEIGQVVTFPIGSLRLEIR